MTTWILVLLFSIGAVLALVIAMSIAFVIREHFLKAKLTSGWQMRKHGATCAARNAQKEHYGNGNDTLCHDLHGNCIPCEGK